MTKTAPKKPTKEEVEKALKSMSESQLHALRTIVSNRSSYGKDSWMVYRSYVSKGTMDALARRGMFVGLYTSSSLYLFEDLSPLCYAIIKELKKRKELEEAKETMRKEQERRSDKGRERRQWMIKEARRELHKALEEATEEAEKAKSLAYKAADAAGRATTKLWAIQQQLYSIERCALEEIALCHEKLGYADSEEEARKMYDPPETVDEEKEG